MKPANEIDAATVSATMSILSFLSAILKLKKEF